MSRVPRLAIVHDALVNTGGAERVLAYIHEMFPMAPIYTSVYLPTKTYKEFRAANIVPHPLSNLARSELCLKRLLLLWIINFYRTSFNDYDIVLTSTTWGAKFIKPQKSFHHYSYCYAPFRLLWNKSSYSKTSLPIPSWMMRLSKPILGILRNVDYMASQSPQKIATTCNNMAREIKRCYNRDSEIINAPIKIIDYPVATGKGSYYLTVSRLISYKRVDLAIKACNYLGRKLIIVGDGPERHLLESIKGKYVSFMGRVSDETLKELYLGCKAVIFSSEEDYGLVPLEAQACGRPVIAYKAGGVLETIEENRNGLYFENQHVSSVLEAIKEFESRHFDPSDVRRSIMRFDFSHFAHKLKEFVSLS
jgi:glycosyltransferase involved in cell wall biosynthesis